MKKVFIAFLCFSGFFGARSQNLIPNPSFEDTVQCPDNAGQISYATPWYSPTAGTPDYFNSCGPTLVSVPLNVWGYQYARTGNAYAEIMVYTNGSSDREYLQVQLIDTLINGKLYCVEFFVSQCGISSFSSHTPIAITEIGLLFSSNSIISGTFSILPYTPQIVSPVGVYLNDTTLWMKIFGLYTATGNERYITIGNFKNDTSTDTITVANPGTFGLSYYYVDDVSVIDCDSIVGVNELPNNSTNFNVYPNPNMGTMEISYFLNSNENGVFEVYDVTGKRLMNYVLDKSSTILKIENKELSAGVYFYTIRINEKIVKTDKLIIIK